MRYGTWLVIAALAAWGVGCSSDSEDRPPPNEGAGGQGGDGGSGGEGGDGDEIPEGCTVLVAPSDDDHATIQGALLDAESGDVVCFAEGRYELKDELSLTTSGVTLRGLEGAVLDFTNQESGGNGILITGNDTVVERLRIENPKGNGIRATKVDGITVREVEVEWTWGPKATNGGYGIYPVESTRVLVENCFVSGASDTGIYVGQSNKIIVRNNEATNNVAGIEIENSTDADVYGNHLYGNTSGVLIFNLPHLAVKDGKRAKIRNNLIEDNNLDNFAPEGNIVAIVPPGTGILVMASDHNEIHDNEIKNHDSLGIAFINWGMTLEEDPGDEGFDWYPEGNYTHDNVIENSGGNPRGQAAMIAALTKLEELPNLFWDGVVDEGKDNSDGSLTNCFNANGDATFLNLEIKSTDLEPNTCTHPSLPEIEL